MLNLRTRLGALHERLGTAGVVLGVIALIVALAGTAYAATKLNPTQKKEVTKIAKAEAKKYANSNPGPAGTNGTNGEKGAKGDTGAPGAPGANGKSVNATEIPTGETECEERGGVMVEPEAGPSNVEVCNGAEGAEGPPGPVTGVLPSGVTLTGVWGMFEPGAGGWSYAQINYGLRLASAPEMHYLKVGETITGKCAGTSTTPTAAPGQLCIYESEAEGLAIALEPISPEPKSGALLPLGLESGGVARGSWAVTAP